ncbi:LacI family transcriptional regulator [Advenella sp. S44]|uniref:Bug family tripartite tricarboxylate transporter substrate binding protein n=1 Tax=Advenella sp. S44 TaxID=1982755 RepID=UPI000C2B065F|nr:tripartite tricarboxylate transporter substrate binding protein [Advenella sp. S44]PJX20998.1 LacI family transcriptional regulator [Advenella sp. S44]
MKQIIYIVGWVFAALACTAAAAASYPDRAVTIVVPFPAGGTTDVLARHLGKALSEKWDQPVVIENKSGASGTIGSADVARSKPNGYRLMVTATHHIINPTLLKDTIPYDTKAAFSNIAMVASVPNVLVVNKNFEAKTVQDLIKIAKEKPGSINFGSAGIGGANHLSGELFAHMAGIKLTHIPYRGAAPSLNDLLAGQIPVMFDSVPGVLAHIQSGALRALGVTSKERVPQLEDTPTIAEAGVKGFEAVSIFGLYGPKDIPGAVLEQISSDVRTALQSENIKKQFATLGATPGNMPQPEFDAYINKEIDKWSEVIQQANITLPK